MPGGSYRTRTVSLSLAEGTVMHEDFAFDHSGTIFGRVAGIREDKRAFVLLIVGDFDVNNPPGLGSMPTLGFVPTKEGGTYSLADQEPMLYTVVAIEQQNIGEDRSNAGRSQSHHAPLAIVVEVLSEILRIVGQPAWA